MRIYINMDYVDETVCIENFETAINTIKNGNYRRMHGGNKKNVYGVERAPVAALSDEELLKIRALIK